MISNHGKGFETFNFQLSSFENLLSLQQNNFGAVESCQQSNRSGSVSTRSDVSFEHSVSDREIGKLFSLMSFSAAFSSENMSLKMHNMRLPSQWSYGPRCSVTLCGEGGSWLPTLREKIGLIFKSQAASDCLTLAG
jgi:hypothetical protein